jgi:hypothetical protein
VEKVNAKKIGSTLRLTPLGLALNFDKLPKGKLDEKRRSDTETFDSISTKEGFDSWKSPKF